MIRLIFSDMDGTLLDEDGNLPAEFGDMYRRLKERASTPLSHIRSSRGRMN